jgi:hypothetical protein
MINHVVGSMIMTRAERQGLSRSAASGAPMAATVRGRPEACPARTGAVITGLKAILVSWWRHRRQADEIAALGDDLREDIGLGSSEPRQRSELRFIAMPDRIGWPPGSRGSWSEVRKCRWP